MTGEIPADGLRLDEPLDDGEVLLSTGPARDSVFHVSRDCPQLERVRSGRRAQRTVLTPLYRECKTCGEDDGKTGNGHAAVDECPRCGETIPQLSTHLQYCEATDE